MTVYNKLKIAILTIISSQQLYAITLDPLQIQSAPGELLYAEMSFHQADANSQLEVGLATPEDLLMIGASHQPPANLNFFTRRNSQGEGTIVITSSRPMTDAELNIILKIKENGAANLKHIRQSMRRTPPTTTVAKTSAEKSLAPKFIVSEKDIALNLPESTRFNPTIATSNTPALKQENLLDAPFKLPPVLNTTASTPVATVATAAPIDKVQPTVTTQTTPSASSSTMSASAAETTANQLSSTQPDTTASTVIQSAVAQKTDEITAENELKTAETKPIEQKQPDKAPFQVKKKAAQPKAPTNVNQNAQKHLVQRNESLWSIAQQISNQTHQPVNQVMKQIKAQNTHAFINGNANRLRQGSRLNFNLNNIPVRQTQNLNQLAVQTPKSPASKTKYRLQQAEMSLVAESNQDASTGSAKKETLQQKISADLSLKVMTAREKTVTLQRNVTQLELALHQKEQRIQLLNARLAELQEQLKARQETKKSTH